MTFYYTDDKFYGGILNVNLFDTLVYLGRSTMPGWYKFSRIC